MSDKFTLVEKKTSKKRLDPKVQKEEDFKNWKKDLLEQKKQGKIQDFILVNSEVGNLYTTLHGRHRECKIERKDFNNSTKYALIEENPNVGLSVINREFQYFKSQLIDSSYKNEKAGKEGHWEEVNYVCPIDKFYVNYYDSIIRFKTKKEGKGSIECQLSKQGKESKKEGQKLYTLNRLIHISDIEKYMNGNDILDLVMDIGDNYFYNSIDKNLTPQIIVNRLSDRDKRELKANFNTRSEKFAKIQAQDLIEKLKINPKDVEKEIVKECTFIIYENGKETKLVLTVVNDVINFSSCSVRVKSFILLNESNLQLRIGSKESKKSYDNEKDYVSISNALMEMSNVNDPFILEKSNLDIGFDHMNFDLKSGGEYKLKKSKIIISQIEFYHNYKFPCKDFIIEQSILKRKNLQDFGTFSIKSKIKDIKKYIEFGEEFIQIINNLCSNLK